MMRAGGCAGPPRSTPGPTGREHCANRNVGERMRDYCLALHQGARDGGGDITLRIADSNFWQNEEDMLLFLSAGKHLLLHSRIPGD